MSAPESETTEPVVIELNEDDVQTVINSVKIIEERFNEDAEIRLNEDQLLIELTNLFFTDIADLKNDMAIGLTKKTKRFLDLIGAATASQVPAINKQITDHHIKPIINAIKLIMLTEDDEEIDPEYEEDHQVKMMFQDEYLRRFLELANSKTQSYQVVMPQIYLWTRSWKDTTGPPRGLKMKFSDTVDALLVHSIEEERTRITGNWNNSGEECDVLGVIVESGSGSYEGRHRFSVTEYFTSLESFGPGDQVTVCLNDFFEDIGGLGDRCTHQARVTRVLPQQGLYLDAHRINDIFVPFRRYSPIMVFKDTDKNHFNKRDFNLHKTIEILFDPRISYHENMSFARPINSSEALFMNFDKARACYNFRQIEKLCLKPYGYTLFDIDYVCLAKLKQVLHLKRNDVSITTTSTKRPRMTTSIPEILNTIKEWKAYCETKRERITAFVKRVEKHETRVQEEIHKIQKDLANLHDKGGSCDASTKLGRVAMRITNASELSDAPADLFFAPSHDPTDYKIKELILRDHPRIDPTDLETKIRAEVARKYPKLAKSDLEFEVKSILKGRRKIRVGDYAALSSPAGDADLVYKLTTIEQRPMWIKVFKVPYNSCDSTILERARQGLDATETCVFDTYEKMCKSIEEAKLNHKLAVLTAQRETLRDIAAFLDEDDIPGHIVTYFENLASDKASGRRRAEIAILEGIVLDDDLDRYFGDAEYVDADAMYANPDVFGDAFAPMAFQKQDHVGAMKQPGADGATNKVRSALENLCEVLGVDMIALGEGVVENITTTVVIDNPDIPVDKDVFYKAKFKSVNQELYKTKTTYRKGVDEMIAKKFKEEVARISTEYYYKVYVHLSAMLALFIMAKYPAVTFASVLSSCASSLAYTGYPIAKSRGESRSIYAYMACVLKAISTPDDERLATLYKTSLDVIRDAIEDRAVAIIDARVDISAAIEGNKENLATTTKKLAIGPSEHEKLFAGFKPEPHLYKLDGNKLELTRDIRIDVVEKAPAAVSSSKTSSKEISTSLYIPESHPTKGESEQAVYFEKRRIEHEVNDISAIAVKEHDEPISMTDKLAALAIDLPDTAAATDDKWWDTVMYSGLDRDFDELMNFVGWAGAATLKSYVITLDDTLTVSDVCIILHAFISTKLPMIMSRLVHSRIDTANDTETMKTIAINMANGNATEVAQAMDQAITLIASIRDKLWVYEPMHTPQDAIKNKLVMMRVFLDILKRVSMIERSQYDMFQQGEVQLGQDVVVVICEQLLGYIDKNMKKQEEIKKRIEELRERRKTELMGAYKANDEDRQLQMTLKSMGLKTWFDVGEANAVEGAGAAEEGLVAPVERFEAIDAEDAENHAMGDYAGMNDDGDADEDLYYQIRDD